MSKLLYQVRLKTGAGSYFGKLVRESLHLLNSTFHHKSIFKSHSDNLKSKGKNRNEKLSKLYLKSISSRAKKIKVTDLGINFSDGAGEGILEFGDWIENFDS